MTTRDENDPGIRLIDAIGAHSSLVMHSGYELRDLADAAAMLGMERMAKRLTIIAGDLDQSVKELRLAHGEAIHNQLVTSERATANMMRGVIAGISLGSKPSA